MKTPGKKLLKVVGILLVIFGVLGLFGFPITLSLLRYLNENGTVRLFK